jgi:hypothetical protein
LGGSVGLAAGEEDLLKEAREELSGKLLSAGSPIVLIGGRVSILGEENEHGSSFHFHKVADFV